MRIRSTEERVLAQVVGYSKHGDAYPISLKARQSCHGILSFCSAISVPEKVRVWWYKRGGGGGRVVWFPRGGGGVDGVSSLRNRPPGGGGGPSSLGWDTGGGGGWWNFTLHLRFQILLP